MSDVALAWIKQNVTSPVVGFSSVSSRDEAPDARRKDLDQEEMSFLEGVYTPWDVCGYT